MSTPSLPTDIAVKPLFSVVSSSLPALSLVDRLQTRLRFVCLRGVGWHSWQA